MEFKRNDLNHMHDTVYDVLGLKESDEQLIERFNSLPANIKAIAEKWGCNDTVFRDEFLSHLEKNKVPQND